MNKSFSQQEIELILKSIGMRIDWLTIEIESYGDKIENPLLQKFKDFNSSFLKKLEYERDCLFELQKRLVINLLQTPQGSIMMEA